MLKGGPLRLTHLRTDHFRPAVTAAGLPERLRLYDLRHTCASLLAAQGEPVHVVSAQLGHASPTVTLNTYVHLFPDQLESLPERMDRAHAQALEAIAARRAAGLWPHRGPTVIPFPNRAGQRPSS